MADLNQQQARPASSLRGTDPATYEIWLACHLDERLIERFYDVQVSYDEQGNSSLSGSFDQSALHGVLNKIRDLNLVILSVLRK